LSQNATPGYTCTSQDYNTIGRWCYWAKDSFSKMTTVNHPWQCIYNTNVPVRSYNGDIQCISTGTPNQCLEFTSRDNCLFYLPILLSGDQITSGYTCTSEDYKDPNNWCYWGKITFG